MKNLRLVTRSSQQLQLDGETLVTSAIDAERRRAFFASSANFLYTVHLPTSSQGQQPLQWSKFTTLDSDVEEVVLEPGDCIVAMDYLMERESLLLGSSAGCLLLYNVEEKTTQVVGRLEGGVSTIASSPDGVLLSVTSGFGQLLVITLDWEVLFETSLDPQNATAGEIDSSGGHIQSAISWRGDGKYFATLGGSSNPTKLTIWERESGKVHSSSDMKTFMGASLDWMPSGAKVATAHDRRTKGKCPLIVFYEKNGLERSYFPIDEPAEAAIQALKWNCNSELLAALISSCQHDVIKIWSCSNNHWYLKHELQYTKKEGVKFSWDPTKPLHLICWTLGGQVIMHRFAWTTAVSETSVALVIDGSHVRVTPLNLGLMPPPMSLFHLAFPCAVNEVSFISNYSKNHLAAYLSNGRLCVVELPAADTWEEFEGNEISVDPCRSDFTLNNCMHLTWIDTRTLISISCYSEHCCSSLIDKPDSQFFVNEIELVCSEDSLPGSVSSSGWQARVSKKVTLNGSVVGVSLNPAKKGSAFIQLSGGRVVEYCSSLNLLKMCAPAQVSDVGSDYGFPTSCPWMTTVLCHENGMVRPALFGLDDSGKLYKGKRLLSNNCSSFTFYSSTYGATERVMTHLLVTTKQDLLFIVDVNDILLKNTEVAIDSHVSSHPRGNQSKEHITVWEKGAKLVGVLHGDEAAVLMQTVRGNLECTYPRKLVLVSIVQALVQRRFRDAMDMVRRHRIDFNIMADYCGWNVFIKSAADFVKQVNNLSHITEFVCSIKNDNISSKLYTTYISFPDQCATSIADTESSLGFSLGNKVTSILMAIRKALEEQIEESSPRELCILTTLARSEPPLLEEALNRIKSVRELELLGLDDARRKLYPSAEESLKHLLWLTDPEAVFNAALGLYDLNLAAIVALNSQKDPKEFLPFLKSLECLPPAIMRYKIDLRLGRYASALKNIISAGNEYHEDCMKLLNDNPQLFPLGLQLFTDPDKRRQIFEAWGDHLSEEKCFGDAALTYQCCSLYQKALKAYRACGDWRGVFTVVALLKLKEEEIVQLAHELCDEFQELGKPGDAARIALQYCSDVDKSVSCYITAREWEEALRVAYMHSRHDLVETVRDAALECATSLISEYQEGLLKVGKYVARYVAVRQRRLLLAAKLQSEERFMDVEDDSISEVSTSFSEMSAYTTRSTKVSVISSSNASKSRGARRQKKGGKIRAGSPGEEMALVEHLKGMMLTDSAQNELKSLLVVLLQLGKEEIARQVQQAGDSFEVSQMAAVKLAEDTVCDDKIDENAHTLEHYVRMLRAHEPAYSEETASWRIRVLSPP
ncbi:elongator complex protein 1 [Phragmites australis]|uniref:elongator complex protein 1 n=1 Tax=Phragmites australis TaxID=29695 RepID=UPI002D76B206|nr:elongator complex protein 1 [Phragmites australis]XP_062193410.1 elongator complex protein 1 [Phragmites australis]